jgi:hypothetical protein
MTRSALRIREFSKTPALALSKLELPSALQTAHTVVPVLSKLPRLLVAISNLPLAALPKLAQLAAGALETVYTGALHGRPCRRFPIVHPGALEIQVAHANALRRTGPKLTTRPCTVIYQVATLQGLGSTFTHLIVKFTNIHVTVTGSSHHSEKLTTFNLISSRYSGPVTVS